MKYEAMGALKENREVMEPKTELTRSPIEVAVDVNDGATHERSVVEVQEVVPHAIPVIETEADKSTEPKLKP